MPEAAPLVQPPASPVPPASSATATSTDSRPAYRRKLFWVALLYFSEGLPLGVFYDLFPVWFRQQGVGLADSRDCRALASRLG